MGDSTASKLPAEILLNIFGRIDNPIDLSKCTCVNKMWSSIANDHHLWLKWCLRLWVTPLSLEEKENVKEKEKERFAKYPPTIAGLSLIKSPKVAFVKWFIQMKGYHELYPIVKNTVYKLSVWLRAHSPQTLLSLLPGRVSDWLDVSAEIINTINMANIPLELGALTGDRKDLNPLREFLLFFHFFDGQKPRVPHVDLGLFGCYSCYGQFVSLFMLPSKFLKVQEIHGFKVIVFAVCPRSGKFLSICIEEPRRSIKKSHFENLDMNDGYNTSLLYKVLEISSITGFFLNKGSFLHFLDNIVSGLENDLYDLHNVVIKEMHCPAISMFRNGGPGTSQAISHGISVEASSFPNLEMGNESGVWVYRIKFTFLGGPGSQSCQLIRRHWKIRYKSGHIEEVSGEGVIGQFPILSAESPSYVYCSICTGREYKLVIEDRLQTRRGNDRITSENALQIDTGSTSIVRSSNQPASSGASPMNISVPPTPAQHRSLDNLSPTHNMMELDLDSNSSENETSSDEEYLNSESDIMYDCAVSMEGYFEFVNGTIQHPRNDEILNVVVAPFLFVQLNKI